MRLNKRHRGDNGVRTRNVWSQLISFANYSYIPINVFHDAKIAVLAIFHYTRNGRFFVYPKND